MSGALAIFKGLHLHQLEGFQPLCQIRVNITLSRLLRQVLFTLGSPPRYQLMASLFMVSDVDRLRFSPPSSSSPSLRFLHPFICSSFVTNAFPCATPPAEIWLLGFSLVLSYAVQMPTMGCQGQMACFLMLFSYGSILTEAFLLLQNRNGCLWVFWCRYNGDKLVVSLRK